MLDVLDPLREKLSHDSFATLAKLLRRFDRFLGRRAIIGDLTDANATQFEAHLAARDTASAAVARAVRRLNRIWRFVYDAHPEHCSVPPLADYGGGGRGKPPSARRFPEPAGAAERARDLRLFFENVYRIRRLIGRSICTVKKYRHTLGRFELFLGRRATLDDLNDQTVCAHLSDRLASGAAPHSVAGERSSILALANFAARKKFIPEFLDIPRTPEPIITPEAWGLDELRRLLEGCRAQRGTVEGLPAADWWVALHLFALDTGERASALLALRWEWVDRIRGVAAVPAPARKGKLKPMRYQLRGETLDALNKLWRADRTKVFLDVRKASTFYSWYGKFLASIGLPDSRWSKLQKMRRTFASLVEKSGGDATKALAHSSRRITEKSYLDEALIGRASPVTFIEQAIGSALTVNDAAVVAVDDDDASLPVAHVV